MSVHPKTCFGAAVHQLFQDGIPSNVHMLHNRLTTLSMCSISLRLFLEIRTKQSAKKRAMITLPSKLTPSLMPWRMDPKLEMNSTKSKGESTQPCFTPLVNHRGLERPSPILTWTELLKYLDWISCLTLPRSQYSPALYKKALCLLSHKLWLYCRMRQKGSDSSSLPF